MTDNNGSWERELVTKLATEALAEQKRRRRWGIFFKLLTFAYITFVLVAFVDWEGRADLASGKKHTAMVELNGIIAPGNDASAEKINTALQAAFKDKNTQGVIMDPAKYNGATLVGLKGIVIKSHGSADVGAFAHALESAVEEVRHNVPQRIAARMSEIMVPAP